MSARSRVAMAEGSRGRDSRRVEKARAARAGRPTTVSGPSLASLDARRHCVSARYAAGDPPRAGGSERRR